MEEQSQRCDDAWSVEDIDSSEDDKTEQPEQFTNVIHCFLRWMEIYGVNGFMEKIDEDEKLLKDAGEVIDLSRNHCDDDECIRDFREVTENSDDKDKNKQ